MRRRESNKTRITKSKINYNAISLADNKTQDPKLVIEYALLEREKYCAISFSLSPSLGPSPCFNSLSSQDRHEPELHVSMPNLHIHAADKHTKAPKAPPPDTLSVAVAIAGSASSSVELCVSCRV